jgi:hypothetical protein
MRQNKAKPTSIKAHIKNRLSEGWLFVISSFELVQSNAHNKNHIKSSIHSQTLTFKITLSIRASHNQHERLQHGE